METILDYLEDSSKAIASANVILTGQDATGKYVIFDRTIFYPGGGGQECDIGQITSKDGQTFAVYDVRLQQGIAYHYVTNTGGINENEMMSLIINKDRRKLNSANHTAGHLICGLLSDLQPEKGYHFSNGPYVELNGNINPDTTALIQSLEHSLANAIGQKWPVSSQITTRNYIQLQALENLPNEKPLRLVTIGKLPPLACGGTHLQNLGEIKTVKIRKMKIIKGSLRVSYQTDLAT